MKVLVTGAAGFIGKKIAQCFLNKGYEVKGWDLVSDNEMFEIKSVDMMNYSAVLSELKEYGPDIVIHCAGCANVSESVKNPERDFYGNVTITHHLLFALNECKLPDLRVVFLSSASVYGNPSRLPISENDELKPLSPYALHKEMCEKICKFFISNYGMDIKIARIFSAYGEGLKKQIFWDMYQKAQNGKLEMFGTGNESRDYIHVDDVVQAIYLLSVTDSKECVFNVANGEEVTIRNATELFAQIAGVEKEKIIFNGIVREGDPLNWKADITKISGIGYKQNVDIYAGLKAYYDWVSHLEQK
ncbi:MAG: NAD-dependent epimerase/dehydratase family protein [Lachnospiraceae bacterium]|nr:NAD-dependent epimerase/dehydratase family protein [Lachnospiraceae bacterium]